MHRILQIALACASLLTSGGCASSQRTIPSDAATDAAGGQLSLLGQVLAASCAQRQACSDQSSDAIRDCAVIPEAVVVSLARGDSHVDEARAQRCLAWLATSPPCVLHDPVAVGAVTDVPDVRAANLEAAVCAEVVVGDSVHCGEDVCAAGDECIVDGPCARHCAGLPGPGQTCDDAACLAGARCGEGNTCVAICDAVACEETGPGRQCGIQECGPPARAGSPCAVSALGNHFCDDSALWCDGEGVCRALGQLGDPCSSTVPSCRPWLSCDATQQVCVQRRDYPSCEFSSQCEPGSYCSASFTCTTEPRNADCHTLPVGLGQQFDSCPEGFSCTTSGCVPTVPRGGHCGVSDVCAVGSVCWNATCQSPPGFDVRCSSITDCPLSWTCNTNYCRPPSPSSGRACLADGDCIAGDACYQGLCTSSPPAALGGYCASTDACMAGYTCQFDGDLNGYCCAP